MTKHEDKRAELLRNLVEARKKAELRQVDVAERMGIGQPSVSEFERGETSPKLETLQKYAEAIGCTLNIYISPDSEREDSD